MSRQQIIPSTAPLLALAAALIWLAMATVACGGGGGGGGEESSTASDASSGQEPGGLTSPNPDDDATGPQTEGPDGAVVAERDTSGGTDPDASARTDTQSSSDTTPDPPDERTFATDPAAPKAYSGTTCPTFSDGTNTLQSNGSSRSVEIALPDDPTGAPILFIFHGLGDTPKNMMGFFNAEGTAATEGAIVIAPKSCCGFVEWPFTAFDDPTPDLVLFDDLISCLDEQFDIDNRRVYATGFSAGAMWTTYLLTRRGEYLAAAVTLSGGTGTGVSYQTPGYNLPVLVVWGGTSDTYNAGPINIKFQDESQNLAEGLVSDDHYVATCDHGGGHTVPWGGADWTKTFLFAHELDDGSSPFQDSVPEGIFPDYCSFP